MKLKKWKKHILLSLIITLLFISGVSYYKFFKLDENETQKIDEKTGMKLAYTLNGEIGKGLFPAKTSSYTANNVECENGVTAQWDNNQWGLININSNNNKKIVCTIHFEGNPVCKRATSLHNCDSSTSGSCTNSQIGNLGTSGELNVGDAFDCDVNGDGVYDSEIERFYYVTDLEEDKNRAVLFYYNKVGNNTTAGDYTSYQVPTTLISALPSVEEWKNVQLKSITKKIYSGSTSSTQININYHTNNLDRAARLLRYKEIETACSNPTEESSLESNCSFLLENLPTSNYWLEDRYDIHNTWTVDTRKNNLVPFAYYSNGFSVRPVIEVPKSNISY